MEILNKIVRIVCVAISVLGAIVVIRGAIETFISFLFLKTSVEKKNPISGSKAIRQRLGAHLLLGLEIFIAGGRYY